MKINLLAILLILSITIAIVNAQRISKFNKPRIDLNQKPQVTRPKLPEERRKLSIFPKNLEKFVITSKPYAKVRTYSPYQVTTKRPVMQKLVPKEMKNIRTMAATRVPIMKYTTSAPIQLTSKYQYTPRYQITTKPPVAQIPKVTSVYESEEDEYDNEEAPSSNHYVAYPTENNVNSFEQKEYEEIDEENADKQLSAYSSTEQTVTSDESIDLVAVESNDSGKVNDNATLDVDITEEGNKTVQHEHTDIKQEDNKELEKKESVNENVDVSQSENEEYEEDIKSDSESEDIDSKILESTETDSKELENSRRKRLSVHGHSVYNNINTVGSKPFKENKPAKENIDLVSEKNDRDEFIFIKDYLKAPIDVKKSSNYIAADIEDDVEIATEIAWLEEYISRPERSINIIEEENLGTTVSGFKFTGREPRVNSDLVFKNINA